MKKNYYGVQFLNKM